MEISFQLALSLTQGCPDVGPVMSFLGGLRQTGLAPFLYICLPALAVDHGNGFHLSVWHGMYEPRVCFGKCCPSSFLRHLIS